MGNLPSISIVVPNLNAGDALGHTLKCLVKQDYPNLQILVADGGSSDNSLDVIRQYEQHLAWWVSEKDNGQSHAINKGFAHATGDVMNWLCSSDTLRDGALRRVGQVFAERPDIDVVAGKTIAVFPARGNECYSYGPDQRYIDLMPCSNAVAQPSCFYRRKLLNRPGPLDESLHYTMDFELWCYFKSQGARWYFVDDLLSEFPHETGSKTMTGGDKTIAELERIYRMYTNERIPMTTWHRRIRLPIERFRNRHPSGIGRVIGRWLNAASILALGPFYGFDRVQRMSWRNWAG